MKILITGTNGFIGKNLLSSLFEYNVLEINDDIFDSNKSWSTELVEKLSTFSPNVIFHVGACSDTLETDANYMMTRNYEFTRILSDWAESMNAIMIYSSSAANYGTNKQHPSNLYGWSKYVAEQYVVKNGGIALRYFNVYGPNEDHKGRMASVAYQMLEKHKKGEEIRIFPNKPKRDFVYVKDVVDANLFAMKNYGNVIPGWYDVGSGEARTFEDVLDILQLPYSYTEESEIPVGYQFYTKSEQKEWMPKWEPQYNLERGLNDYLNYL